MSLPTLYKRTSTGAIQQWYIDVYGDDTGAGIIETVYGQVCPVGIVDLAYGDGS